MINRVQILRKKFTKYNIDVYVIPKNDDYVTEYSKINRLKIISNFSGSAGLAVILKNKNYLFTDGRYTIQSQIESGKNFKIINVLPLTQNFFLLPWRVAIFFFSILKSFTYLKSKKIKTIISTGGYMSLPICISAKILNLKVILFEPNLVLGRSNLFFLNYP